MSLQEVTELQSSLDNENFNLHENATHDWTEANDSVEAHLASEMASDLLTIPANRDLRDTVYRYASPSEIVAEAGSPLHFCSMLHTQRMMADPSILYCRAREYLCSFMVVCMISSINEGSE